MSFPDFAQRFMLVLVQRLHTYSCLFVHGIWQSMAVVSRGYTEGHAKLLRLKVEASFAVWVRTLENHARSSIIIKVDLNKVL